MKKLQSIYVLIFLLASTSLFAQTGMKYWALPPQKINFNGASPTSTSIPILNGPSAVYNGYYTDQLNHSVKVVGTFDDVAGNGSAGYIDETAWKASFNQPAGIVTDGSGNIYVSDKLNHVIRKINSSNVVTTFAGSGTAGFINGTGTAAQFNNPTGLAIDASNNIYVADYGNHSIRKISPSGVVTTIAGNGFPGFVDGSGGTFNLPASLIRDSSGNLFVADYGNNSIRKITPAGVTSTVAGASAGGLINATGTSARFSGPFGIAIDGSSNLYVSEKGNHTLRKITTAGVVTTLAGDGTSGNADGTGSVARFNAPAGITFNGSIIIVADYGNKSLRQVTTAGVVTTYAVASSSCAVSNSVYDGSGNILFYVKDDYILNSTGATVGRLTKNGALDSKNDLTNDIEIVPVPGTCRDFFIVFGLNSSVSGTDLRYTWVSVNGSGVVTILYDGLLIGNFGGNFIPTAVSKLKVGNTRELYSMSTYNVYRHSITSTGINAGSSIYSITSGTGNAHDLDLSPDGNTLAWAALFGSGSSATINFLNVNTPITYFPKSISIGSYTGCHGVEFSSDNLSLYLSMNSTVTANQGIYKLNISAGTSSLISGTSGHYGTTQLETAGDGYLYAVDGNSTPNIGMLGRISTTDVLTNAVLAAPVLSNYGTNSTGYTSLYRLPSQVHGQDYSYFFGVDKPNTAFTINGAVTSPTIAVNTYTCSTITLGSSAGAATSYTVTVKSADASGNIIAGYSYTTGLVSSVPPATIDIKALNSNYLLTNTGYYLITFYGQNTCVNTTYSGLIQNSTISAASANFLFSDGNGNTTAPQTNLALATLGCTGGVSVSGSNSTGYIATYQIVVDKVNPTTGVLITANIVNTAPVAPAGGNPANIVAISLNTKSVPKNYFILNQGTFKITYTVTNACGATSQIGYFMVDGSCRLGKEDAAAYKDGAAYPNPSNGITHISFYSSKETQVKVTLMQIQGNSSSTMLDKQPIAEGLNDVSFDTSTLPGGVYLYQVSDAEHTIQSGKLVITK